MDITVYTKPDCQQCNATCRALDKRGLDYAVVDVTEDADARDYVSGLGYLQAPVVVAGDQHWSGFRPDRVKALPEPRAAEPDNAKKQVTIGGMTIPAYERPDVAAVEQWAGPFIRSASKIGEIPAVGSAEWVALPSNDPRKTGAVAMAAIQQVRAVAGIEDRVRLEVEQLQLQSQAAQKQASLDVGDAIHELGITHGPSHHALQKIRYGADAETVTRQQAEDHRSPRLPRALTAANGPLTAPKGSTPHLDPTARPPTPAPKTQPAQEQRRGMTR
ncbi:glutaredoxin-like protein NrdH [Rhodococcus hoagii]|nr:glutaredoxin-like protein NrdH [Prescottella equi]NKS10249.1 glutaredoxin-like protein NrdH [Prescottella equi]NKS35240.1 glutaredoxin-like protein NrdH [Prescottella equi]NKS62087.1 glutaredoxin-like protein NrdH [Prescottella equi]NKS68243.1 glutaredoxin-like protein NrdH [Prescottella equi]